MIDIFKNRPPKKIYLPIKKYEKIEFKKKYSIDLIEKFFKRFPEEKRGRKKFREKEIQNTKILIYEKILQKGHKIKEIGRAHVRTPVTRGSRMPSSA